MKYILLLLITHCFSLYAAADIRLPKIFGNNMVLQRGKPIPVWGWAQPGESVRIQFNKQEKKAKAGKDGKWNLELSAEIAGGPYTLTAIGKNTVIISNILVGEVWICSGQSNMEMTVASGQNAEKEIQEGNFPQIRHIKIPNNIAGTPVEDIASGEWQIASSATVGNFTGVGYFFARKLFKELNVPIGLVNSSWGGSMVETWISREELQKSEDFKTVFDKISFNDIEAFKEKQFQQVKQDIEAAQGMLTPVPSREELKSTTFDHSNWKKMPLPGNFNEQGLEKFDGAIWFRKSIILDKTAAAVPATLNLSTIDDMDEAYVNGELVGSSNAYNVVRQYTVPAGVLKEGMNVIAVRITDNNGNGGLFGKPTDINLTYNNQVITLAGDWSYKIESVKRGAYDPNSYPTLLFNSMINPLLPFAIQGVLWYQGETNASRAYQYRKAFPIMINDWRTRFRQGDFPFYFVQLASYDTRNGNASGSEWAELREAQTKTLSLPNTGMAIALDIGETNDIHPKNKQEVGNRLAAIALNQTYKKNTPFNGPVYQAMQVSGAKAIVSFANVDSGFLVRDKYNYIKGFEIAGADKKFYYAKAYIENNKIVVHSDAVSLPVAVRYGWADDMPEANLYNKQGFPAGPFHTDSWPGITDNEKYSVAY